MLGFIIGLFLGAFIGTGAMCLCNAASRADEMMNAQNKKAGDEKNG